ncbi:hypothetical protein BJ742DRAFT_837339 [Cladochytrium replicatum]|nr:hypothetical protein BJ742DRAFT_837339 [Cladochytrium replicatum]
MISPPDPDRNSRQSDRPEGMEDLASRWKKLSLVDPSSIIQNHDPSDPTFPSTSSTALALRSRASSAPISVHTSTSQCTLYCLECALSSVIAAASALTLNSNTKSPRRRGIATSSSSSSSRSGLLSRPNSPVHHHWTLKSADVCSRGPSHARVMKPPCAAHRLHQRTTIDSAVFRPLVPPGAAHRIQLMRARRALLTSGASNDPEELTTPEKLYIASLSAGKDIATLLIVAPPPSLHDLNFDNADEGKDSNDKSKTEKSNGATGNDDMTLVSEFTHLTLDTTSSSCSSNTTTHLSSTDVSNTPSWLAHLGIQQTTPIPPVSFAAINAAIIDRDDGVTPPSHTSVQSFMPYIT